MQRRWKLSSAQRADMWGCWKAGQSLHAIGRALGKDQHVIHFLLARHGGIAPPVRRRSPRALTLAEREDVSRGIASGCSLRVIAQYLSRERPAEVEDRAVPGHWEGDLLRGAGNTHVVTLVERKSRFCVLVKLPGKDTATVVAALIQHVGQLPAELRRSLTWDRGLEMAEHKSFTMATDVQVYFCDPQSPWQRGSNENTNGLLRQYLPKNADLSRFSQSELDEIALRLNTRPRQILGFRTPADKLQASVASTP